MKKFQILDTGVFRADPYVIVNELQEAVAQSIIKDGGHYAHGLREITNYIASLETRLQEAEAIIKPIAEHAGKLSGMTFPAGTTEVAHFITVEQFTRAAAWLKGGTN